MIWIIIFLTALMILLWTLFQNSYQRRKHNKELDLAHSDVKRCESRMTKAAKPVLEKIMSQYGEQYASNIANRKISERMPTELMILSWGKPGDIKTKVYKGKSSESWFYDGYINRLGNTKYRTEVFVENNKIVGWKDLS